MGCCVCDFCCCWLVVISLIIAYKWLEAKYRRERISLFDSRYIFITGCDTGFGYIAARRLDALGCHVIAGCLTERGENELRTACSSRLKTVSLNVANHDSVTRAYDTVKSLLPPGKGLWGIINNAGVAGRKLGQVEWLTLQDYTDVISVNLLGLVDVTTTFLPLVRQERGRIVNTASVMGRFAFPGIAPYSISKYGVEAFSDTLRREMLAFGVSVHIIEPGFFKTDITRVDSSAAAVQAAWDQTSDRVRKDYGEQFLSAVRDRAPNDIASFFCSDRVSLVVDAYEHALLAVRPHPRYVIGTDAKFIFLPVQWMPEWLGDWLISKASPLPRPTSMR